MNKREQERARAIAIAEAEATAKSHPEFDGSNIDGYDPDTGEMRKSNTARAYASGVRKGVEQTVGQFGGVGATHARLLQRGAEYIGLPQGVADFVGDYGKYLGPFPGAMTTEQVQSLTDMVAPDRYEPQGTAEQYADTMGQFAPSAFSPGGLARRVGMVAAPALMSEAAGQYTEGTGYEPYARLGAGIAGSALMSLPVPGMGSGRSSKAATQIIKDMQRSGKSPDEIKQALAQLGDDGALIDLPEFQQRGQRIYAKGGEGRQTIGQFLRPRDEGAGQRIRSTLDDNLGKALTPTEVKDALKAQRQALSPEYEKAFANARRVDTQGIVDDMMSLRANVRGRARGVLDDIMGMMKIDGTDQLDPHPRALHAVREAIDGMRSGEQDGNVRRILGDIRKRIDNELAAKVPGIKQVDAKYANLMRQQEAFDRGVASLDSGRSTPRPAELADEIARGGPEVKQRMAEGARADIDRMVGTTANDRVALNRAVKGEGDWNRDKLGMMFGQDKVAPVIQRLDSEKTFANTSQRVMRNSATAERLPEEATKTFGIREATMSGGPKATAYAAAIRLAEKAVEKIGGASAARNEAEIARMLTDSDRNRILTQIMKANGGQQKAAQEQLNAVIRMAIAAPVAVNASR